MPSEHSLQRLQARAALLADPQAQACTLYRPDEDDLDAEEVDLGDAKVLFIGPFEPPQDWDAPTREAYYDDLDPELFVTAYVESEAAPGKRGYFEPAEGDYLAAQPGLGEVVMYYVSECELDERGVRCVLIRDEEELD